MSFRLYAIPVLLSLLSGLSAADAAAAQKAYHAAGRAVVDMANTQKVDVAVVEAKVTEMTRHSVEMARAYAAKFPAGKTLIDVTIAQAATLGADGSVTGLGPMKDLSFSQIEDQWHDLGYFKANPAGIDLSNEDNEHFTDPLHTIIHPIMTLVAARDFVAKGAAEDLKSMKAEMEEGLEQAEKLVQALGK
jgi:hypothetical protein